MLVAQSIVQFHPVLRTTLAGGGYEWGWSFWVALGTVLLAAATAIVAYHTSRLAARTRELAIETTELAKRTAEDVASQFRPVLVSDNYDPTQGQPVTFNDTDGLLTIRVRNAGRGPALDVKAIARPSDTVALSWHRGAVPTEANVWIRFEEVFPGDDGRITIELLYRSLGVETYQTTVTINCASGMPGYPEPTIEDVEVHTVSTVTTDAVAWLLE